MEKRLGQFVRYGLFLFGLTVLALLPPLKATSAPYAAMVIDARSGEVLHSRNADTRLHPASLTKMMTLYVTFDAISRGELSLDSLIKISSKAANEPPSKLGLKAGQKIKMRYLIRAASVKSANDAATALGEAVSGSEAAFARRMNRTAKALGMSRTTFKNAHGLTETGHLSTARDMTTMGRRLFFDFPQYYNLFSRKTTNAGIREVANTNRRFLGSYKGADGIKTGYTRAAGFNLVASAERGNERIITTVFGGRSSATRNAKVAELMDLGFRRAPTKSRIVKPKPLIYADIEDANPNGKVSAGKTIRLVRAVKSSIRPLPRPSGEAVEPPAELLMAMKDDIQNALSQVKEQPEAVQVAEVEPPVDDTTKSAIDVALTVASENAPTTAPQPKPRPANIVLASLGDSVTEHTATEPIVVTRISTSGGRHWGINVGKFNTRYHAERILLKTALTEMATLDEALRKVVKRNGAFDANFVGMSQEMAALACRRLSARNMECETLGPS